MSEVRKNNKFNSIDQGPTRLSYEMIFASKLAEQNGTDFDPDEKILRSDLKKVLDNKEFEFDVNLNLEKIKTHEESFIKGWHAGEKSARDDFDNQVLPLRQALQEASVKVDQIMDDLKPYIAGLVFDLAEKVVNQPIENDTLRESVQKDISNILSEIDAGIKVKIQVSKLDYDAIKHMIEDDLDHQRVDVRSTDKLNPGEYRVETSSELIVKEFKKILRDFRERVAMDSTKKGDESC